MKFLDDEWFEYNKQKIISAENGNNFAKGELFENYALTLFPDEYFSIVKATTRKYDLDGRMAEDSKYPDFLLRDRETGKTFWIECKFRSWMDDDGIRYCSHSTVSRYIDIDAKSGSNVYVLIGFGGLPYAPEFTFLTELDFDDIGYGGEGILWKILMKKYEVKKEYFTSLKDIEEHLSWKTTEYEDL